MCLPFVARTEILFLWVRWIIIAPKILPKTSGEFLPQQLSCLPSARDLASGLLKLNIFKEKKKTSVFQCLNVSVRQLREALAVLKGQWFSLKGWFSVLGTLKFQNPRNTLKMTYALNNFIWFRDWQVKTVLRNSAKPLRSTLFIIFPNGKLFSEEARTLILAESHIPAYSFFNVNKCLK